MEIGRVSNSYGTFKIDVPKGQYLIQITNIGFETVSSLINVEEEDIVLDIAMEPVILELDEVSVEALFSTRLGYESAKVILKSEVAGAKWGRDELWGIRIAADNQVMYALKHFNEADAFLVESN